VRWEGGEGRDLVEGKIAEHERLANGKGTGTG
jgi:hypothetical protein